MKTNRCTKPWYRPRNIILALVAVVVTWIGVQIHWAYTAQPTRNHTYVPDIKAVIAQYRPAGWTGSGPNGVDLMLEFNELMTQADATFRERLATYGPAEVDAYAEFTRTDWSRHDRERLTFSPVYHPAASGAARAEVIAAIEHLESLGVNELLDDAATTQHWDRQWPENMPTLDARVPELGTTRRASDFAVARFVHRALQGDEHEAVRSYRQAIRLAVQAANQPTMIDRLVSNAMFALVARELAHLTHTHQLSEESLAQLQAATAEFSAKPPLRMHIECDKINSFDFLESVYAPNGVLLVAELFRVNGDNNDLLTNGVMNFIGYTRPRKHETRAAIAAYFDDLADAFESPPAQRKAAYEAINTHPTLDNKVAYIILANHGNVIKDEHETDTLRVATDIIFAIERHRALTGSLPASLTEIDPSLFSAGSIPIDPRTERPFQYRPVPSAERTTDDPRPYLIWVDTPDGDQSPQELAINTLRPIPDPPDGD